MPGTASKPLIGLTCRWDEEKGRDYLPSEYAEAVAAAGGVPVLIPLVPNSAPELTKRLDAVVLTGSAGDVDPQRYGRQRHPEVTTVHPQRDATDFAVLDQAFREKKPVLGICFGMQSLNVYLGGALVQHIPAIIPNAVEHNRDVRHDVQIESATALADWADNTARVNVNSSHHQAVEKPGRSLRVAAVALDGVIEAVEGTEPDHFVVAVQWHPERIWKDEPLSARLFAELVGAAIRRRQQRPKYADVVNNSLRLSQSGKTGEAISLVEQSLQDPSIAADKRAIGVLAGHAAVMCHSRGDYQRGIRILEKALGSIGENPAALYALGDMYLSADEPGKAKDYFIRCYDACVSQGNQDYLELLETKAQHWK
jgi:putative glutamine amidotransferase